MRSLSASELLQVWERACREHPVDRALTLLCACCDQTRQELAKLSLGRRDTLLLEIYERLFGPDMEAFAQCPQCGERLEYRLSTQELMLPVSGDESPLTLDADGMSLLLRLPNSFDLRAASECADPGSARRMLLQRCIVEAQGQAGVPAESLPECTVEKIEECLAQADPQAETLIDLTCCACRHSWQVLLDVEKFLWVKISALAKRLLREVHTLAWAYGWRESEILALSSIRRQAYLEMVGS